MIARLTAIQTAGGKIMCRIKVENSPSFELECDEATEETDQPPSEMERALLEEVGFWKNYIEYCLEKDSASVPVAAYEALAQSERQAAKLQVQYCRAQKTVRQNSLGDLRVYSRSLHRPAVSRVPSERTIHTSGSDLQQ